MKGHGWLEHYRNFHFTSILLHFANSLRIILAFLGDHCGAGLQLILPDLMYYCTMKEYRKNKMAV